MPKEVPLVEKRRSRKVFNELVGMEEGYVEVANDDGDDKVPGLHLCWVWDTGSDEGDPP